MKLLKQVKMKKDETRTVNDVELRVKRADDESPVFYGVAIRYNSWSEDLGGFRERIKSGACRTAIKTSDTRALINHDPSLILGRTKPGRSENTLILKETNRGLEFEVDMPDTNAARDLAVSIERGDIDQCSFSFRIADGGDEWKEVNDDSLVERTISEFSRISDVSIVTYPAYEDTSVALRSLEEFRATKNINDNENRDESDDSSGECTCGKHKTSESNDDEHQAPEYDSGKLEMKRKRLSLKVKQSKV